MKKLAILFTILALIFVAAYFLFPILKNDLPSEVEEKEPVSNGEGEKKMETPVIDVKPIEPISVRSQKGLELWYNGYGEGIVSSFPSYVPTETSDFLEYNLDYNEKSIVLTWKQKRGTLKWINLKIFRYEKLVFNKTSNESSGKMEYVHNDPLHHHSPSVTYSFEKREPGTLLYFNLTNRQNTTVRVIVEKATYIGAQEFDLASENFVFGNVFEIPPFQARDLILSYPNTIPPHGEVVVSLKYPERGGKLSHESLRIPI